MGLDLPRIMMPESAMASVLQLRSSPTTSRCYCCPPAAPLAVPLSRTSSDTSQSPSPPVDSATSVPDLDTSLRELGMLSSVIDARRDYLVEKLRRGLASQSPPGLCILAMNSAYLADISMGRPAASNPAGTTVPLLTLRRPERLKMLRRRHHCFFQPYSYPWRPKLMEKAWALLNSTVPEEEVQENGNKSNPGSPAKSQGAGSGSREPGQGPSHTGAIFRSRSLDDLAVCSMHPRGDPAVAPRLDIDTVSHRISNLRVS